MTIQDPPSAHGFSFNVFVNPPQDSSGLNEDSPSYAATLQFFGVHHHDEPVSFTVPIGDTLNALAARNMLKASEPLRIVVIPESKPTLEPHVAQANFKSSLAAVSVGTF